MKYIKIANCGQCPYGIVKTGCNLLNLPFSEDFKPHYFIFKDCPLEDLNEEKGDILGEK